jgi:hypothetical protein
MPNFIPLYYFKLVDSHIIVDYGVHDLLGETVAQIEAIGSPAQSAMHGLN